MWNFSYSTKFPIYMDTSIYNINMNRNALFSKNPRYHTLKWIMKFSLYKWVLLSLKFDKKLKFGWDCLRCFYSLTMNKHFLESFKENSVSKMHKLIYSFLTISTWNLVVLLGLISNQEKLGIFVWLLNLNFFQSVSHLHQSEKQLDCYGKSTTCTSG